MQHPLITPSERRLTVELTEATSVEVPFPVFSWDDLVVMLDGERVDAWSGVEPVSGILSSGTIRFEEPVSGSLTITSHIQPARDHDFIEGAGLPVKAINNDLDRLAATDQEVSRDLLELRERLHAEVKDLAERASQIDAAIAKTVRTTVDLDPVPVGCDKDVLAWNQGQIVNMSVEALLARAISVRQERPEPISLCDIDQGVFIGCPGDPVQLWECFDMCSAPVWDPPADDECQFGEPLQVLDLCQFPTGLGPHMRSVTCATENEPAKACVYFPIH